MYQEMGNNMRLVKFHKDDQITYTIVDVSVIDLANLQLALVSTGQEDLKAGKVWESRKPSIKPPLTINEAGLLGDLYIGVERGYNLRYYPDGAEIRADGSTLEMVQVLRAFTKEGGDLYPHNADVRDAFVWTSGFKEHWFHVGTLLEALDNMDGKHGLDHPMAVIDKE
jgi:hypothetical protein